MYISTVAGRFRMSRSVGVGLDDVAHRRADLDGVVDLGAGEALRAVLVADVGARQRGLELLAELGGVGGDLGDAVLVEAEHHPALEHRRGVVEVDDRVAGALQALVGALDQLGAALREHLDGDVVGDEVLLDELPDEVEVGLAGRREADLDLLEAHLHDGVEHPALAGRVHRVDERLVAVAEVDRAPQRRLRRSAGPARCGRAATSGRNGRYLSKGIVFGVTGSGGIGVPWVVGAVWSGQRKTSCHRQEVVRASAEVEALAYISRRRSEAKVLVMPGHLPAALPAASRRLPSAR